MAPLLFKQSNLDVLIFVSGFNELAPNHVAGILHLAPIRRRAACIHDIEAVPTVVVAAVSPDHSSPNRQLILK